MMPKLSSPHASSTPFEDQYGVWDPDGGLADGETLEASWDDEAWDDPDA